MLLALLGLLAPAVFEYTEDIHHGTSADRFSHLTRLHPLDLDVCEAVLVSSIFCTVGALPGQDSPSMGRPSPPFWLGMAPQDVGTPSFVAGGPCSSCRPRDFVVPLQTLSGLLPLSPNVPRADDDTVLIATYGCGALPKTFPMVQRSLRNSPVVAQRILPGVRCRGQSR